MYVNDMDLRTDELIFVAPAMEYADEIVSYRQEMLEANCSFDGCFSMKRMPNPKDFIEHCAGWADTDRELGSPITEIRMVLSNNCKSRI